MKEQKELIILSPMEMPNTRLVLETIKAGAYGVLHLGADNKEAEKIVMELSLKTKEFFGVCVTPSLTLDFELPANVTKIIVPFGYELKTKTKAEILYQVHSLEEVEEAIRQKVSSIIIKGSEGAGHVANISSFEIFRKIIDKSQTSKIKIYIQGGAGIHTSAAFLALGAQGIIFDSQIALFPECSIPQELKSILQNPEKNETEIVDHFRTLRKSPILSSISSKQLAVGQDIGLAIDFVERYKTLRRLVAAFYEAVYGHLRQAKNLQIINYDNSLTTCIENKEQSGLVSDLLLWEKQIVRMLQKEKNFSKFSILFPIDVNDVFLSTFVSVMAASVAAKGVKIGLAVQPDLLIEREDSYKQLQLNTQERLLSLEDISPMFPISDPLDIAVIGMDCIYPAAANLDEYWKNILLAKDCVTEVPTSRWDKDLFYKPNNINDYDYSVSKWGGFIPTVDFDPVEFGLVPQSLFMTEPAQLLSLLVTKRALLDAGYKNLSECDFENTSIFFGANSLVEKISGNLNTKYEIKRILGNFPEELKEHFLSMNEYTFPGILPNIITGRIANRLNFGGRNYTVDAACASSLAALDVACRELRTYHSDMVILGGVDLHNAKSDYLMFSSAHVLSSKGYCATFDADADGIALGEGVGVLILKRLEDAERDGNKIYAVLKGVGGSSDGRHIGVTAPSRKGEALALERTYLDAGIFPSQVGMIEAHGTGTVVGDRVELAVLTDAFIDSGALPRQTYTGSVKSQIGHTKCAAGVGGLIKAILSIYHGIMPPTIHLNKPNTFYDSKTSPFKFNKRVGLWRDKKRIAAVSAFGFGGTNFHALLENYSADTPSKNVYELWPSELFVFRGEMLNEAKVLMQKVVKLLSLNNSLRLSDIAYSLALYNDKNVQVSIVAGSTEELLAKMNAVLEDRIELKIYHRSEMEGKVAFLFPGQGSQYVNMARDLFVAFPQMRHLLEKKKEYISILFPETAFDDETREAQERVITETHNTQPLLGIVDLAIAEYLRFLGIKPDMLAGHSYGELPALCFAGVISPDDLIALSQERAHAMLNAIEKDKGKLVAVMITEEELKPLLEGETEVWPANYNSPRQVVLGGTTSGMESFLKKAKSKNIICAEVNVDCAFHSPLLAKSENLYLDILKQHTFKKPEIPVWANMTAETYPEKPDEIKAHLAEHMSKPIEFTQQIENMYEAGVRIFIEVGPGRIVSSLVEAILGKKVVTIQTDNKSSNEGITFLLRSLGQYLSLGQQFNIGNLFDGRTVSLLDIDEPEQYKKSSTGWLINGHEARPSSENKIVFKNNVV